jgi:threonine/homoserine/homoserine lactone efflux protein
MTLLPAGLALACSIYAAGAASPGPSNLTIMSAAMHAGRRAALALAAGVVTGSLCWGMLAALGFGAVIAAWREALIVMKTAGALYLLWLAFKAARSAISPKDLVAAASHEGSTRTLFVRGLLLHLTNPQAIFTWLSFVAVGSSGTVPPWQVLGACAVIGVLVFGSYAVLFSPAAARRGYDAVSRWFHGALALVYGYAGLRLLAYRNSL